MSESEIWVFVMGLVIGGILSVLFDRMWARLAGKRHKLTIRVLTDTRDTGDVETLVCVKNAGDYFERDVAVNIETAVSKGKHVRFIGEQVQKNDQAKVERTETRSESPRFSNAHLALKVNALEEADELLVRILSECYIPTFKVSAVSDNATARHDDPIR